MATSTCDSFSSPPPPNTLAPGPAYDAAVAFTVLFPLIIASFVWIFFAKRKYSTRLRKRDGHLLVVGALNSFAFWACTVLYDVVGGQHYPCALFGLLVYLACPLTGSPILLKVLKYSAQVSLQKLRENKDIDLSPCAAPPFWRAHFKLVLFPRACSKQERIMNARFARTTSYAVLWASVASLPYLLAYLIKLSLTPAWRDGCKGCEMDLVDCILLLCLTSADFVMAIITVGRHVKSKRDPLRILHECFLAVVIPGLLFDLAIVLYMTDPGGAQARGEINYRSLMLLTSLSGVYIQSVHQVYVAGKKKRAMLAMDRIDMEDRFLDVRLNRDLNRQFQTYLYKELSGETLHFLDAVDAFRQAHSSGGSSSLPSAAVTPTAYASSNNNNNTRQMDDDALAIFRRFIEPNRAPEEVNLPHSVRDDVARSIAARATTPTMFDAAYADVKNSLLKDAFARFVHRINLAATPIPRDVEAGGGSLLDRATPRRLTHTVAKLVRKSDLVEGGDASSMFVITASGSPVSSPRTSKIGEL